LTQLSSASGRRNVLKAGLGLAGAAMLTSVARRARAAAPDSINIAFFTETSPSEIAKANGWIEEATKAKVNWIEVGSGAEINTAVAAGSVDIGIGIGSAPTAAGLSQGIGYQVIYIRDNIGPAEELTVRTSANIKKPSDLIGKKVATPFGSTSHFRLLGFLKTNGLTQRQVTVLDLRPDALVAAWQRGDIDAAYVWAPAKSKILAAGGEVYRTYDKLEAAGYVIADLIVARTAFTEAYPETVVAVVKTANRALDLLNTSPDKAAEIVAKQAGVSVALAKSDLSAYDFVSPKRQLQPEWLGTPGHPGRFAEVLQGTAKFLKEQKSIRSVPDLEVFQKGINTVPLTAALA
jgi:taurine transport system substrate-binding protein